MKYRATVTSFKKSKEGMLIPHTENVYGSKTFVFNRVSEIMKSDFESITLNISHDKNE